MEIIEHSLEIKKMKNEIKLFMQKEIQPMLKIKIKIDCMASETLITFHYCVMDKTLDQYFSYKFVNDENGVSVYAKYIFKNKKVQTNLENNLDNIFIVLKKEVKKNMLSLLYDK
jgi:hypothetical protein